MFVSISNTSRLVTIYLHHWFNVTQSKNVYLLYINIVEISSLHDKWANIVKFVPALHRKSVVNAPGYHSSGETLQNDALAGIHGNYT